MRIKRQLLQSTLAASLLALSFGNAAAALGKTINVVTEDELNDYQQYVDQKFTTQNDAVSKNSQSISTNSKAIDALAQYPRLIKTYKGCELSPPYPQSCQSDGSLSTKGLTPIKDWFSYGPDIQLPEGTYRFIIKYESTGGIFEKVGFWNVDIWKNKKSVQTTKSGIIYATDKDKIKGYVGVGEIQGQFTVDQPYANQKVQVRTYLDTNETVVLKSLSIYQVSR